MAKARSYGNPKHTTKHTSDLLLVMALKNIATSMAAVFLALMVMSSSSCYAHTGNNISRYISHVFSNFKSIH